MVLKSNLTAFYDSIVKHKGMDYSQGTLTGYNDFKKVQINWYTTSCVLAHVFQFQEDHFKLAMILTCLRLCNPLDGALHLYKLTLHNFSLEVSAQDRVYAHGAEKKLYGFIFGFSFKN